LATFSNILLRSNFWRFWRFKVFVKKFINNLQRSKDLELAARIGQQLLEQNKELQHRNEFLEVQLTHSNGAVVALKNDLNRKGWKISFFSKLF